MKNRKYSLGFLTLKEETNVLTLLESKKINYEFDHLGLDRELVFECTSMKEEEVKELDETLTETYGAQFVEETSEVLEEGEATSDLLKALDTQTTQQSIQEVIGAAIESGLTDAQFLALLVGVLGSLAGYVFWLGGLKDKYEAVMDWMTSKKGKPTVEDLKNAPGNVKESLKVITQKIDSTPALKKQYDAVKAKVGGQQTTQTQATTTTTQPTVQKESISRAERLKIAILKEKIEKRTGKKVVLK